MCINLVFFLVGNFDAEIFFGCEISGSCNSFFLGGGGACNMKFHLTPIINTASTCIPLEISPSS